MFNHMTQFLSEIFGGNVELSVSVKTFANGLHYSPFSYSFCVHNFFSFLIKYQLYIYIYKTNNYSPCPDMVFFFFFFNVGTIGNRKVKL
jgi:hypothetical protein